MESSKQGISLPKSKQNKQKIKQKVKQVKRKLSGGNGTNCFYLWSRGNSKKKNKLCIARKAKTSD